MASSSSKKITLKSFEGETHEVEESVAMKSPIIKQMIEEHENSNNNVIDIIIPLSNISSNILGKVIEYCKKHVEPSSDDDQELKKWDEEFVKVDLSTLKELLVAASDLNIRRLIDSISHAFVDLIKGKSSEEVRMIFGIKNDFTPEEEEALYKENQWLFE